MAKLSAHGTIIAKVEKNEVRPGNGNRCTQYALMSDGVVLKRTTISAGPGPEGRGARMVFNWTVVLKKPSLLAMNSPAMQPEPRRKRFLDTFAAAGFVEVAGRD